METLKKRFPSLQSLGVSFGGTFNLNLCNAGAQATRKTKKKNGEKNKAHKAFVFWVAL